MAKIPSVLADINSFIGDTINYAGLIKKAVLPNIAFKTKTFSASGMAGDIDVVLHRLEKLTAQLTFSSYEAQLMGLLGSPEAKETPIVLRGYVIVHGGSQEVKATLQGVWHKMEMNEFSPEQEVTVDYEVSIEKYILEIDNKEIFNIDLPLNKTVILGKDRTKAARKALAQD